MLYRAGTAVSIPVLFSSGAPDGGVDWFVYGPDGTTLGSGTITVPVGAVSTLIQVSPTLNALANGSLVSYRDVAWSYTVGGIAFSGDTRYNLEARAPFGVSADGVRSKLGVDAADLPDSDISLITAYHAFANRVTPARLTGSFDDPTRLIVANAIEALVAISLIPTMSIRIAAKESSGTNQYQRQKIDWAALGLSLEGAVAAAENLLIPGFDPSDAYGSLLILATPAVDPYTGAESSR
jgi:hypothetical protein